MVKVLSIDGSGVKEGKYSMIVEVPVEVPADWFEYCFASDLFYTNRCGYWMRGVAFDSALGWLAWEHNDERPPSDEASAEVELKWRAGEVLPERWHRLDREAAARAWCEGVKRGGFDWWGGEYGDAGGEDVAVQKALLGEVCYG